MYIINVVESGHLFQLMKMKSKIEKSIINITLICENDNYCELKFFIQINNYYELERVKRKNLFPSNKINFE